MSPHSRAPRLLLASLLAAVGVLTLTAAPASALKTHLFSASFGTAGAGAGQLSLAPASLGDQLIAGSGVAVNSTTHDVYVADTGNHRVDQFSAAGNFIRAWGWGVADGSALFQTCTTTCQAGISGSGPGQFESPIAIAVDNSGGTSVGDVYVADSTSGLVGAGTDLVQKFDPSGNLISSWVSGGQLDGSASAEGPFTGSIFGIAVDDSGNLWVDDTHRGVFKYMANVFEFTEGGAPLIAPSVDNQYPAGLAVDSSDFIYISGSSGQIEKVNPFTGEDIGNVTRSANERESPLGLSLDPSDNDLYVSKGSLVHHYAVNASGEVIEPDGSTCPVTGGGGQCDPSDTFGAGNLDISGDLEGSTALTGAAGLAVDPESKVVYVADTGNGRIAVFTPGILADLTVSAASNVQRTIATLNGHLDPDGGTSVSDCRFQYVTEAAFQETGFSDLSSGGTKACDQSPPIAAATDLSATVTGLRAQTAYRYRIVASNGFGTSGSSNQPLTTLNAVTDLKTGSPTEITNEGATLHASFTGEEKLQTEYFFEYGTSNHYGHKEPVTPGVVPGPPTGAETQNLSTKIENLFPGTTYHYRIVATDEYGIDVGEDEEFSTDQPPTIDAFSSFEVTATSAVLHVTVNPQGFATTCHFEYGTTTAYGQTAPCPAEITTELSEPHTVEVPIKELQRGATYHFRLIAESKWGTVNSEDQSFQFFPPSCPNSAVRQQTGSAYLPDCRAYELVSPGNANGTLLFSGGPNPGTATSPSRFSYVGAFSTLPGVEDTIGTAGDLYVATRTDTGWVSRYVGLPGNQAACMSGPPNYPWSHSSPPDKVQDAVLTDPGMNRFLDWVDDDAEGCIHAESGGGSDNGFEIVRPSLAPYLWSSEGTLLGHLPAGFESTPGSLAALACPLVNGEDGKSDNAAADTPNCSGDVAASADLTHLFFSSRSLSFAQGGLTKAPGSAYDDDLATGKLELISVLEDGEPIPQDPSFAGTPPSGGSGSPRVPGGPEEFLRFPAVSADGSHVLISTATSGTPICADGGSSDPVCSTYTDTPVHLYMRVDDALTYKIAENPLTHEPAAVRYVGMTTDGSKVFFTSEEHLTAEDLHHGGASLFMWEAAKVEEGEEPLTLISKPDLGSSAQAGETENCEASWIAKCGVLPYSGWSYAAASAGLGGNGISDSALAAQDGDIYFYSPEQLDGDRGILGQENLYDYRDGKVQFVASFTPGHHCQSAEIGGQSPFCADGPIARFQVTPDDSHMAFLSEDQLTSYDNAGHLEMYSYTPSTGTLVCDSCNPDGQPATADVSASQDGLFLTDDGRSFFSTPESLVPQDTNEGIDVYEFAEGRPQLITPGTGTATVKTTEVSVTGEEIPGLIGVSANGTDVYFSTYDSLISEDHNGNFLKFYDARTDGGFPQPPPAQPCAAAEECHGPGTEAPTLPTQGTVATLAGGNATPEAHQHAKKHHKRAKHKRHNHRADTHRGGSK